MNIKTGDSPNKLLEYTARSMGMSLMKGRTNPFGNYFVGDGVITKGYLWYYSHEDYFVITKCDFVFCSDCMINMPYSWLYIALRLDYANHLPPGKIISFMEEKGDAMSSVMKKGMRVSYTEVMYFPVFYRRHLDDCFPSINQNPIEVLRNMGGEHNWPSEMFNILLEIKNCKSSGAIAGLYYVGKAYELISALLTMGTTRAPRNEADYSKLLDVINYINEHVAENIKQKDLLKIANMSPTKLKSLFKQFTGFSVTDYISEKKADKAAHLLSNTDLNIEEISAEIGFETPSGFATFFKKHIGIAPTSYRKQMEFYCIKNPSESDILSFFI